MILETNYFSKKDDVEKKDNTKKLIMPKRQNSNKKGKQSNFAKLSIFQPNKYKFKKIVHFQLKVLQKLIIKI